MTPAMREPRSNSFGRTSTSTRSGARVRWTDASPIKVVLWPRSRNARLAATRGGKSPPAPPLATTRISLIVPAADLPVGGDVLGLEELQQPLVRAFAPDPALFDAAE